MSVSKAVTVLLLGALAFQAQAEIRVGPCTGAFHPEAPVRFEKVSLHLACAETLDGASVAMTQVHFDEGVLRVRLVPTTRDIPPPVGLIRYETVTVPLGAYPAGQYRVVAEQAYGEAPELLFDDELTVSEWPDPPEHPELRPALDYSGLWWDPQEPGWAVSFSQNATGTLVGIFAHYEEGNPTWYLISDGRWVEPTTFRGTVFRTHGPSFDENFDKDDFEVFAVGQVSLLFDSPTEAGISITVNGDALVRRSLRRFEF